MKQEKILLSVLTTSITLTILHSCTSSKTPENKGGFYHSGIYFGAQLSPKYQQGIVDGCKTAKGYYSKSHKHFVYHGDYANGWFLGRNRCKHLLKINENGDLIS